MTTLCFLWHMHQPFYKDLWTGEYKLPWTRLHAMKDYSGMVRILEEFPSVRQTFNLVPSMIAQIEDYATGAASDPFLDVASIPAEDLTEAQRHFMHRYLFQANVPKMIHRYPRYRELFESHGERSTQDLRDLQVLSQIAWFDEDALARDAELQEIIRKGRDFSRADQELVLRKERDLIARVLPTYREFAATGQIEISTTPFYHPILPLICDTEIASVAHPGVALPHRFQYPQDARDQLCRAKSYMRHKLGIDPVGLWPSEGSVSDEALALAADCGFRWAASDNGVLARTLHRDAGCDVTYQAYEWHQHGRSIKLLFRDHFLSDLIGFTYQRVSASEAADHFLAQIRNNAQGRDALVPIILDGENAWEYYDANGRPFLRELYRKISEAPDLEAVTISEALARFEAHPLGGIFPGSWINANFDIWIGAEEDNQAWNLLLEARRAYDQPRDVSEDLRKLAYEELLIAEGSDWNWWYGPEHGSDNRAEFDQLYRDHLSNVYRALGIEPPEALARPILRGQDGELLEPPANQIHPVLDGEVTSYFEWLGAGRYRPDLRSGAMHGGRVPFTEMFYGSDGEFLYVRLDGASNGTFAIEFENGRAETEVARARMVELKARRAGGKFRILREDEFGIVTIPADRWIEML